MNEEQDKAWKKLSTPYKRQSLSDELHGAMSYVQSINRALRAEAREEIIITVMKNRITNV